MAGRKAAGSGDVAKLAALLPSQGPARGRGRHSSLYRWLQANRKDFAAMLATMQPAWRDVATGLAALGLRDGDGKPPTGERARKAWWDVQRGTAARRRGKATPAPPPLAPGEIAPGVRATETQASAGANPSASPWASTSVRPPPSGQASLAGTRSDLDQAADENDPMRRLRASMDKAKVPMPRPV